MRKLLQYAFSLVLLVIIGVSGYFVYQKTINPCSRPLKYSVGRFDAQFGISKSEFISDLSKAEIVWEKALSKNIFIYDPEADFEVNLIYDERQLSTVEKRRTEFGLSAIENELRALDSRLASLKSQYNSLTLSYEAAVSSFNKEKEDYENQVAYWNNKGGAPRETFLALEEERKSLNSAAASLNSQALSLNKMADDLNILVRMRNSKADDYNRVVEQYNKKYKNNMEFDQAEYNGRQINVYQYGSENDLIFALAHEFGHALGLGHIDSPDSVMYYLTRGDEEGLPALSSADITELRRVCRIK